MKKNAPCGVHFFYEASLVCLSCEEGIEASFALAKLVSRLGELAGGGIATCVQTRAHRMCLAC